MPPVKNTSNRDFTLPSGHVLKRGTSVELPRPVLENPDNVPVLNALTKSRRVTIGDHTPVVVEDGLTRTSLAKAKRADLLELWEAYGGDLEDTKALNVDELREELSATIFLDL